MQPLEERMEELGGGEFLEVFVIDDGDDEDGGDHVVMMEGAMQSLEERKEELGTESSLRS